MLGTPSISPTFFFNDPATTEIYTLSLHDALPIYELVVLGARFIGDGGSDAKVQAGVPGRRQADRLRKDRRAPGAADTVEALVPPIVSGDAEPVDGRRIVHHLPDFFFERHAGDQVVYPLLERSVGIAVERRSLAPQRDGGEDEGPEHFHVLIVR